LASKYTFMYFVVADRNTARAGNLIVYLPRSTPLDDTIVYKHCFEDVYILDFELAKAVYTFNRLDYSVYAVVNLDKNNVIAISLQVYRSRSIVGVSD